VLCDSLLFLLGRAQLGCEVGPRCTWIENKAGAPRLRTGQTSFPSAPLGAGRTPKVSVAALRKNISKEPIGFFPGEALAGGRGPLP